MTEICKYRHFLAISHVYVMRIKEKSEGEGGGRTVQQKCEDLK